MTIWHQLRKAAEQELVKSLSSNTILENDIMQDANNAFSALSAQLGDDEWFFEQASPSLFDASVFAYTHLILDESMAWTNSPLSQMLVKYDNLVQHSVRIYRMYF
jgi:hypothetical protein